MREIRISDVTISEYAGGNTLTFREKLEMARLLDRLGIYALELPKIAVKKADSLLVKSIAAAVENSVLSLQAGLSEEEIREAYEALKGARAPRLRIVAPVSAARMEYVYHIKAPELKETVRKAVSFAAALVPDVEFVAEDATRSDTALLSEVLTAAQEAGAKTVTVSDMAGQMLPAEFSAFITGLLKDVPALSGISLGVRLSNALNLADALALSAAEAGASEIKVSALPADSASLSGLAGILKARGKSLGLTSTLKTTELNRVLEGLRNLSGGKKSASSPFEDGVRRHTEDVVYTDQDGIEELMKGVAALGYDLQESDRVRVYNAFRRIAERKGQVTSSELDAIVASEAMQVPAAYTLDSYMVTTGNGIDVTAHVKLKKDDALLSGLSLGDGPIDAAFLAIERITGRHFELDDFQIQAITEGREAMGQTVVRLRAGGKVYSGRGISTDIIGSGIEAYINALNKVVFEEENE